MAEQSIKRRQSNEPDRFTQLKQQGLADISGNNRPKIRLHLGKARLLLPALKRVGHKRASVRLVAAKAADRVALVGQVVPVAIHGTPPCRSG